MNISSPISIQYSKSNEKEPAYVSLFRYFFCNPPYLFLLKPLAQEKNHKKSLFPLYGRKMCNTE